MSKKLVAAAWISMRYSFAFGSGSGMVVTLSCSGPCAGSVLAELRV